MSDDGPDMVNRDPNDINGNVRLMFEDVIGEPEGAKSIDCVWRNAYKCFNGGKKICYLILTTICGLPLACCWGCEFACLTFAHVWCVTPYLKERAIYSACARNLCVSYLNMCLAPCCEVLALFFSKIVVQQG